MEPERNPHEEVARLRKAIALCDVLDFLGHEPNTLGVIQPGDWSGIATLAKVNDPSHDTINQAIVLFEERRARQEFLRTVKGVLEGRTTR